MRIGSFFVLFLIVALCFASLQQEDKKSVLTNTGRKDKPLKILIISDLNAAYGSVTYSEDVAAVVQETKKIKPDLVLCAGDMVAGQKSTLTTENLTAMWSNFKTVVLDPLSTQNIPFGFTLGNHDASPSFALDRSEAEKFWKENKKATSLNFIDATYYPYYFSYLQNNVFIISWDASGAKILPEVYNWMKMQLEGSMAKNARYRIVLGHLPLYAIVAAKNKPGEVNAAPEQALEFFSKYKVDMYISGHQHAYFPAEKNGIQLYNVGCIGNGPRQLLGHDTAAKKAYSILKIPVKNPKNFMEAGYLPGTNQEILLRSLPDSIVGFNGTVIKKKPLHY